MKLTMRILRSENVYRSMAALTSLICISSTSTFEITLFFVVASEVEPFISHVDTLVGTLEDSNSEKQFFRALVGLARATTLLFRPEERHVPADFTHDIRTRMIQLLHVYRYARQFSNAQEDGSEVRHRSGGMDILTVLSNACSLLALNNSCLFFYQCNNRAKYAETQESAYFLLIFSFHLLHRLDDPHRAPSSSIQILHTYTSTLLIWLDNALHYTISSCDALYHCDTTLLQISIALRGLFRYVSIPFPKEFRH